ncbi:hypothetical protein ACFL5V_02915 [Fibrobacterota bacterium]
MGKYPVCMFLAVLFLCGELRAGRQPFNQFKEWESGKAEILEYKLKKVYMGKELVFPARLITEGKYYSFAQEKASRKPEAGYIPILNFSILYSFKRDEGDRHSMSTLKFSRRGKLTLARQDVSIQSWDGQIVRQYNNLSTPPVLEARSWLEGGKKLVMEQTPVFTTEQLFVHLRDVPLEPGYMEKIRLLGSLMEDMVDSRIYYAEIKVHKDSRVLRDQETRYISVTREDKKKLEFWVGVGGLRHVVSAILPDGTTYMLDKVNWQRYWLY